MSKTLSLFFILVSRKFRFFSKNSKISGKCSVIRHFLENQRKSEKVSSKSAKIEENLIQKCNNGTFCVFPCKCLQICKKFDEKLLKFCDWSGAKEYQSDRSRQGLSNWYLIAKIDFDTAENEPLRVWITDHIFYHIPSLLSILP